MTADFEAIFRTLATAGVEHIVIGGVAATLHGSAYLTQDVDVVYRRSQANIARLVTALAPLEPYLRGAPKGLPFRWDASTIRAGLNFTLTTAMGDLDLLGEVTGGGLYEDLLPQSVEVEAFGLRLRCLGLEALIRTKRAAGRAKDLVAIAELEALRDG